MGASGLTPAVAIVNSRNVGGHAEPEPSGRFADPSGTMSVGPLTLEQMHRSDSRTGW